jgi:hypothetical protein
VRHVGLSRLQGMTLSIPPFYEHACRWITAAFLEKSKRPIFYGGVNNTRAIQRSYAAAWWEKASEKRPTLNMLSFEEWMKVVQEDLIEVGAFPERKFTYY